MQVQFVLTGLLVGTLVGLTGMGGGSLMTPILVLLLGMQPSLAVGTDLVYASLTKLVGTVQHLRQRQVRFRPGLWVAAGSVPATIIATALIGTLLRTHGAVTEQLISRALGGMLLVVAALLLLQPLLRSRLWPQDPPPVAHPRLQKLRRMRPLLLVVLGVVVGFCVGLTSVGAGSLVMVALLLFFPRWPMSRRVGTDVFQGFLMSAAAGMAHLSLGTVNLPIVGQLLIGSIPGVLIGTRLTKVIPESVLRPAVAGVLTLSAVRLL